MSDFITKNLAQIIVQLTDRNEEKNEHIYMIENELSDYQKKTKELKEALAHAETEVKRLIQENGELQEELGWNEKTIKVMADNYQTLGYKNVELEELVRKATQQYNDCVDRHEKESERFDDRMDECERENEKLETKLENRYASDKAEADYYLDSIEYYIREYENVHKMGSHYLPMSWYVQKIVMKHLIPAYPNYEFKNCVDYLEIDFDPSTAEL